MKSISGTSPKCGVLFSDVFTTNALTGFTAVDRNPSDQSVSCFGCTEFPAQLTTTTINKQTNNNKMGEEYNLS